MRKNIIFLWIMCLLAGCSSPDLDILKADRLSEMARRSYRSAVRLYANALRHRPKGKKADATRLKLGQLYLEAGDYPSAVEELSLLSTKESRLPLAQALFKNADYTGALEVFNKLRDLSEPEGLYYFGLTLEKNNLYDKALGVFSKIEKDPVFGPKAKARIAAINHSKAGVVFGGIDEEVRTLIEASPGAETYPEASGLYLLSEDRMTLTEDNRLLTESHYVIKILNDRGKENFGEVVLTYDSTYEKLDLEVARTIKPDGTVVTVGDKNIRDVSLYMNYPLYSNARARIISMPEVTAGCSIEYKVRLSRAQLPNKKDFDTTYWLQADEPILLQRCAISLPASRGLRHKIINAPYNTSGFDMTPRVISDKGRNIFSLEFKDVPQIIPEPAMPPMAKVNPYVLFSTFESWQEVYVWWRDLCRDKTVPDADIQAKVAALIKDKKTPEEKIRSLYNFCVTEIRYVAVEYGDAGYEPHAASEIFKNKYGDCKDKAILLITMLREAGIEAFPVLISTSDSLEVQEDLPSLLFNHAIAAVRFGEKLVFMDVTASTASFGDLPPGDQDRLTLVFLPDRYELVKTPLFPSEHNKVTTQMKIKVAADESMEASRKVDAQGAFQQAQRYWLKYTMPVLIEETLKQKARGIADSAVLQTYEIKNVDDLDRDVVLAYAFSAPQYFTKAGSARLLPQLAGLDTSMLAKETRRYPIEFGALEEQAETIEVELPGHLAVKYVPEPVALETKWFSFSCRYEVIGQKTLKFSFAQKTKERLVGVEEYPAYKKAIEDIASSVNQQVVLEELKSSKKRDP